LPLLDRLLAERVQIGNLPPLLLKIGPDLSLEDYEDIASIALSSRLDGIVVSNTTVNFPEGMVGNTLKRSGGLSGRPLFKPSTEVLADLYFLTDGRVPLIGVGGVESAEDAYNKIRAGASLVQLYTAFVLKGPKIIAEIKVGLAELLRRDGFKSVGEAVGDCHQSWSRLKTRWKGPRRAAIA
jgi:dihydroorotate dehydrogenase